MSVEKLKFRDWSEAYDDIKHDFDNLRNEVDLINHLWNTGAPTRLVNHHITTTNALLSQFNKKYGG